MKNAVLTVFILMAGNTAYAQSRYPVLPKEYKDKPGSTYPLTLMSPVKDQNGIGLCYSFAASILLEHHRCMTTGVCQSKDNDERLSTLDISSFNKYGVREIHSGGSTYDLLSNIKLSRSKIVKESCAPYESLIIQRETNYLGKKGTESSAAAGYDKLKEIYKKARSEKFETCAHDIQQSFGNKLQADYGQLMDALNAFTFEEFAYKTLIPESCKQTAAEIPEYTLKSFPSDQGETANKEKLAEILINNVKNNIPTEASICFTKDPTTGKCIDKHATIIENVKEVCKGKDCRWVFKVHNSYGLTWQESHNNGWVDGDFLLDSMMLDAVNEKTGNKNRILTWIHSPQQKIEQFSTSESKYSPIPSRPTSVTPPANSSSCSPPANAPKGLYKCTDENGKTKYSSRPTSCNCEKIK